MNYCPQKAIEVSPLVILLFTYLTSIPVAVYAGNWLAKSFAIELEQLPLAGFSIQYLYILLAVAVTYRLLHMALGIRPVRKLVGALSHTRFFRRYQAAGVTLRQIHR